jgi:hypothetical protein
VHPHYIVLDGVHSHVQSTLMLAHPSKPRSSVTDLESMHDKSSTGLDLSAVALGYPPPRCEQHLPELQTL